MKHKKEHDGIVGHSKGKMHHAKSMKMGREGQGKGFVEGHDEGVGHGDFANLPQEKVVKMYPKASALRGGMIDDTITGIDAIDRGCEAMTMRHLSNQK